MTDTRLSKLAWLVTGFGLGLLGLGVLFTLLRIPAGDLPDVPPWYNDLILTLSLSVALLVGGFVAARLPRNPYGWVLLAFGLGNGAIQVFAVNYGIYSYLIAPRPLPLAPLSFVYAGVGFALWFSAIPFLFLLFPTGRLPSRRWWPVAILIGLSFLVLSTLLWLAPSAIFLPPPSPFHKPGAVGAWADNLTSTAVFVLILATLLGAISVIVRAVRATGQERQQFKWLGLASVLIVLAIFFNTELVPLLPDFLDTLLEAAAFAGVPLAVGVAVLRYRLWDIDVVIRKTVQYALITGLLAIIYLALVVVLQGLFTRLTGQQSTAAVVLSTLAIAALFTPVRRRVQGAVDRRFYRRKYNAEQVLERFTATARDETDLDRLTTELVRVIEETMQPETVSVWLKPVNRPAPPDR